MKKLSKITESIWSDMQDRSSGDKIRQEDKFNPDYVDFGDDTTVYWAIDNLEIDGEGKFYFDDIKDYNNNGWRLPTVDEVNQLKWNIWISWYEGCDHLKFDDGNELKLKTNDSDGFHMWTKEINTKFPDAAYAYGFDNSHDFDITSFNKSINRLFVFLVKDKKITESIWSDMQDRSAGEVRRKEDGVKVHTCIDVDIYLKNTSDSHYDNLIKEILNYNDSYVDYKVGILNVRDKAYSTEAMKNMRAFEAPYAYLIYDGRYGTSLVAEFYTYDEMKDFELDDFEDRICEEDYISICKGIATKLKEVGGNIEYLPRNKGGFIETKYDDISHYEGDYVLQLIDESDVYNWEIEYVDKYGEGSTTFSLDDYKESMIGAFPELDDIVFITWSYNNYACNIGIPITATTVKNFKKYKEFTKNWFTIDEEAE